MKLWYLQPAREWQEALPVGNGRLGGMIYGGTERELIQLNEISFWSGWRDSEADNPEALEKMSEIRQLLFAGKYAEANRLTEKYLVCRGKGSNYGDGADYAFGAYQPLCDLRMFFEGLSWSPTDYRRELDLNNAVSLLSYRSHKGVRFTREVFTSHSDQVMVVRLTADQAGKFCFSVGLDREFYDKIRIVDNNRIVLQGRAHQGKKGMKFECHLLTLPEGGRITKTNNNRLFVEEADAVTILVAANTSRRRQNPKALTESQIESASKKSYEQLCAAHVADYQNLFGRVELDLGSNHSLDMPTDKRLESVKNGGQDFQLEALCFQYGRYLLISCSRPGSLPANLQGLWNDKYHPAWSCDYHTNINLQMNYWLAEPTGLPECHVPLLDFIDSLRKPGRRTAKVHYGARGWIVNWATNIWGFTAPGEDPRWGLFPAAAGWLCRHLWEHYEYTCDRKYLESVYPIMKEAAQFFLDYLVEDPRTGLLVTGPSNSPENSFKTIDGQIGSITMGPTMEMEIAWDLFTNCIKAGEVLAMDEQFIKQLAETRARLAPLKIGRDGRLQEWMEEFEEPEPGHRHISHAYALYPGEQIPAESSPKLMQAIRKSIEYRLAHGGGQEGWSAVWLIGMWSRLGEGDKAYAILQHLFKTNIIANLFNRAHGVPQLDGTFGLTACISEMLLQSHAGIIRFLPALPSAWPVGHVRGLRARGGFEIDIEWQEGKLNKAVIKSLCGTPCCLTANMPIQVKCQGKYVASGRAGEACKFETEKNTIYNVLSWKE